MASFIHLVFESRKVSVCYFPHYQGNITQSLFPVNPLFYIGSIFIHSFMSHKVCPASSSSDIIKKPWHKAKLAVNVETVGCPRDHEWKLRQVLDGVSSHVGVGYSDVRILLLLHRCLYIYNIDDKDSKSSFRVDVSIFSKQDILIYLNL